MNPQDPLEIAFAKLARDQQPPPDLEDFQSGVWREIRHRDALRAHAAPIPWWTTLGTGRVAALAACLSLLIGVSLGVTHNPAPKNPNLAAQHLDLEIFSSAASGLPSNALASRK